MSDAESTPPSLGFRLEKMLSLGLLVVPCVAVLSASIHFLALSSLIGLIPSSLFSLQDHFDKAVDLLIPVFVAVALMHLGTGAAVGVFDESRAKREKKPESYPIALLKDWTPPVLFIGSAVFIRIVHPAESQWMAVLFGLMGTLTLSVHLIPNIIRRILSSTKVSWLTFLGNPHESSLAHLLHDLRCDPFDLLGKRTQLCE